MNRRTLMKLVVVSPTVGWTTTTRESRLTCVIDGDIPVQIISSVHLWAQGAERFRRAWIEDGPFEHQGEWSLMCSEQLDLPADLSRLPGTLMSYQAVVGAAAQERHFLVGSFRRDHVAYIVRMQDGSKELLIGIAEFFADQPLPSPSAIHWIESPASALFPTADDLGVPLETVEMLWF